MAAGKRKLHFPVGRLTVYPAIRIRSLTNRQSKWIQPLLERDVSLVGPDTVLPDGD